MWGHLENTTRNRSQTIDEAVWILAERPPREHSAQVYSDDTVLMESLRMFTAQGLSRGEAVVLIVAPSHHDSLLHYLKTDGIDVDHAERDGHLLLQDAAALLARFMVGDMPDRALFKITVGDLVANAAATHRRVRVFGEIVDLLWRSNLPAAICIEHLWNELLEESNLSLFCAYAAILHDHFPTALRTPHSHIISSAMIESFDDAVVGHTLDRRIVSWNGGAQRLYGYSPAEVIGQSSALLMPPGENELFAVIDRIRAGERVDHYEARRRRKDGTVIDVSHCRHTRHNRRWGAHRRVCRRPRHYRAQAAGRSRAAAGGDRRVFGRCHHCKNAGCDYRQLECGRRTAVWLHCRGSRRAIDCHPDSRGHGRRTAGDHDAHPAGRTRGPVRDQTPAEGRLHGRRVPRRIPDQIARWRRLSVRPPWRATLPSAKQAEAARLEVARLEHAHAADRLLLRRVFEAQEQERQRIARELHDEAGQLMASLLVGLRALEDATTVEEARDRARHLREIAVAALDQVSRLARGLHTSVVEDLGLIVALKRYVGEYAQLHHIAVDIEPEDLALVDVPQSVQLAVFRIVQEALTNVAKHSGATSVSIRIARSPIGLETTITDNGSGFSAPRTRASERTWGSEA